MAKKKPEERELAELLFFSGLSQKEICERLKVTPVTIGKWISEGNWRERKAAATVTRTELINKTLNKIADLLDDQEEMEAKGFGDKLIKLVNVIERLDKKGTNVIQDIESFMLFSKWLMKRQEFDKEITLDLVKAINKFQDIYIGEKMNGK